MLAVLCLSGIVVALYPFHPELTYRIQEAAKDHPTLSKVLPDSLEAAAFPVPSTGTWLHIPSINVTEQVLEGPDLSVLDREKGAWHQMGNVDGNYVIAGHRFQYLPPNTETFYHLAKLEAGDEISLFVEGRPAIYKVAEVKKVDADQTQILEPTSEPRLTLYTCGDSELITRTVVIALPVQEQTP